MKVPQARSVVASASTGNRDGCSVDSSMIVVDEATNNPSRHHLDSHIS